MNTAYLIFGGNKGDKLKNLRMALQQTEEKAGTIFTKSDIYVTAAWGNTNQPDFINQAIGLHTSLSAKELLQQLLSIEKELGRVRDSKKWLERTMDIDILFYNNEIINTTDLKIPHPYIRERKFVLIPLAQIVPELIHPVFNKTIATLLAECKDELEVKNYG